MIGGVTERKKKQKICMDFTFVQIKMDICPIKKN